MTVSTSGTTKSLLLAFYFSNAGSALTPTSINSPLTTLIKGTVESEHDGWASATGVGYGSITTPLSSDTFQPFNDSAGRFNGRSVIIDCIDGPLTGYMARRKPKMRWMSSAALSAVIGLRLKLPTAWILRPTRASMAIGTQLKPRTPWRCRAVSLTTIWDPTFTSPGVDLQSLNLTIVNQEAFNMPVGSRSNTSHSTGKFYAEFGTWVRLQSIGRRHR